MRNRNSLLYKLVFTSLILIFQLSVGYGQCSVNAGNDTTICQGQKFVRTANITGTSTAIKWYKLGSSSVTLSTTSGIDIRLNTRGVESYIIKVTSGATECYDTVAVTVNPSPSISIGADITLCQTVTRSITATFRPANGTINWYKLPNLTTSIGTGSSFSIPTGTAGTSDYVARIDSANTCSDFDTVRVVVNQAPTAAFTSSVNCGRTVSFNSSTSQAGGGTITKYEWDFGVTGTNNDKSNQANPTFTYPKTPDTYTVTLKITNSVGCVNTITRQVTTSSSLEASMSGVPSPTLYNGKLFFIQCEVGLTSSSFTFFNNSSTALQNTTTTIIWGDNKPNTIINNWALGAAGQISHTYSVGIFNLKLIVSNGSCTDTTDYGVYLGANPGGSISSPANTQGCTGSVFSFPFSNTSNNPPGTMYYIYVNDGSDTVVYTQENLPAAFTHRFDSTSCGTTSDGIPNTFKITYLITNPCDATPGSIGGIKISRKAKANFSITPYDTVCVNSNVIFTDLSLGALTVGNQPNCAPGKTIWQITPSSGWTKTSGEFGSDLGFPNSPNSWTAGTPTLGVTFNTPGIYTIKLISGNNICGNDEISKTICVNPIPTADFTMTPDNGCAPLQVTANGTTNTPTCGQNRFNWTVSYQPTTGCFPNNSDWAFVNGTNANSQNPQFSFVSPGEYTISLQTFAPNDRCSSAVVSKKVIVRAKPNVSLSGIPPDVCESVVISPNASASCYIDNNSTYAWTFPSGTPASSTQLNPGTVNFSSSGTKNIQFSATNQCGTTTATANININPTPTITGNLNLCTGATTQLTVSGTPASSNAWTSSNTSVATVSNTGLVSGVSAGTTTITYSTNIGCQKTVTIVVKETPARPNPSSSSPICSGKPLSLSASISSTMPVTWNWTGPNSFTSTSQNPTVSNAATNNMSGIYTVTATATYTDVSLTCPSQSNTINVTVNPVAVITATSTNPTSCASATGNITISGLTAGSIYTVKYVKGGATQTLNNQQATAAGTITIANLSSGTYNDIEVLLNDCASNKLGPITLSDPTSPVTPVIPVVAPICSGNTLNLSASTSSTNGTPTWSWSGPNGFSSSSQNPSIPNASTAAAGTYSVTVTINNCTSAAGTRLVVVDETPAKPQASSNSPVCSGNTLSLNASTTSTMPVTWSWTGPNSYSSTTKNPTVSTAATTNMSGDYTVTVSAQYSASGLTCSSTEKTNVVVNPTPAIGGFSKIDPTQCASATGSIILTGLTASTTYNVYYTTTPAASVPVSLTSNGSGSLTIPNLKAGTYSDIYVEFSNCPSNKIGPVTLIDPNPPSAPTAPSVSPICSGNTLNLSASTNSTNGTPTWSWSGPNGFSSSSQNPSIPNASTLASGTYRVNVTINNCKSDDGTVQIVVDSTPAKPNAGSNSPVCSGNVLTLNASTVSTMPVIWSWVGPNSYTSSDPNPTVSSSATSVMSGTYIVKAAASYTSPARTCISQETNVVVVVNPTPQIGSFSKTNPSECETATGSITLTGLTASTTYNVYYTTTPAASVPVSLTSNGSGSLTIPNLKAGTYSDIYVEFSNCPSNKVGPVSLVDPNPPTTPTVPSVSPICSGNTLNLSASTSSTNGTPTWSWSGPNGFSSSSQNPSIPNASTLASGTYLVNVTINKCKSDDGIVQIVVDSTPAKPVAGSNSPVCSGNVLTLNASTASTMPVTWSWSGPNSYSSTTKNPTVSTAATTNMSGDYTVTVSAQYSASGLTCSSTEKTNVVVNLTPAIGGVSKTDPTQCASATGSIILAGLTASTTYNVYYTTTPAASVPVSLTSNGSGSLTIPNLKAGTYSDIYVEFSNCPSNKVGPVTLSDPNPPVLTIPSSDVIICAGQPTGDITFTSNPTSATINWTNDNTLSGLAASGTGSITSFTGVNNGTSTEESNLEIQATLNNCTSAPQTMKIVVNPTPVIKDTTIVICSEDDFKLSPSSGIPGNVIPQSTTYTWTIHQPDTQVTGTQPQAVAQNDISGTLTNLSAATKTVIYLVVPKSGSSGSCDGPAFKLTIKVNPKPSISNIDTVFCSDESFSIDPALVSGNLIPSGTTYTWIVRPTSNNITGAQSNLIGTPQIGAKIQNTGNQAEDVYYDVTPLAGTCPGEPFVLKMRINPLAAISNFPLSQEVCNEGTTSAVIWTSPTPGATFSWKLFSSGSSVTGQTGDNSGPTLLPMQLFNPSIQQEAVVYEVSSTAAKCSAPSSKYTIYVNPDAKASFTYQKDFECWPFDLKTTALITNTSPSTASNRYEWFANGQLIGTTREFPGYTIPNPNEQVEIKLIAYSQYGCKSDIITHLFRTKKKPAASFTSSYQNPPCAPLSVNFTNTSEIDPDFTYTWNYGLNTISVYQGYNNPANPNVVYPPNPSFGDTTYIVTLTVANSCFSDEASENIIVSSKPQALFVPSKTTGCSPLTVDFTNVSKGVGNTYEWFVDDVPQGQTSNHPSFNYTFITGIPKTYKIKLVATNGCGLDEIVYDLKVIPNPIKLGVFVNGSEVNGCAPHTVNFNNNSSGAINFQWDFKDNNKIVTTKNTDVVPHTFNLPGTYNVEVKATSICSDTTGYVLINVYATPIPSFSSSVSSSCIGQAIQFQNNSTGANLSYNWDFGDGKSSVSANPSYSYTAPGTYSVKLTVTSVYPDGTRCSAITFQQITIVDELPIPVDFTLSSNLGTCVPFTINFENQFQPYQNISWYIDGALILSGQNKGVYTFTKAGKYKLKLLAIQTGGCKYTAEKEIEVKGVPLADFTFQPPACVGQEIEFKSSVQSEYPIASYNWKIAPTNQTYSTADIKIKFLQAGAYTIELVVITDKGCPSFPVRKTITVHPTPVVIASPDVKICQGGSVNLSASSPSGSLNYTWFPDNYLNTTNIPNPVATPPDNITYTVKGTNQFGCSAYATSTIGVVKPFNMTVSPDANICIGQSIQLNASGANSYKWTPSSSLNRDDIQSPLAKPTSTTTYKVLGMAELGCFPVEKEIKIGVGQYPVVNLGPDVTLPTGTLFDLKPQTTNGPIVNWNWTPPRDLSCNNCEKPQAYIRKNITYNLVATNEFGCSGEDDISIKVFCENTQVYIPNAFTPGSGISSKNDVFYVQGKGIMKVKTIRVFNRWGEIVFEQMNISPNDPSKGWDGRTKGVIHGPDVFGYIVEVLCDDGTPFFYKGNVTLLK